MTQVVGLRSRELASVRGRLVAFAEEMLAPVARRDQRRWGEVYVRGLMLDGKRKSIEPMAERLPDGDEQCLQQFVNQSPWDPSPVLNRLVEVDGGSPASVSGGSRSGLFPHGFPKFLDVHAAAARKRFTPRALSTTANLTALIPRTRRCFTPVSRSKADIVDSTPDRCR